MKTILIACAMTITISTAAVASAVSELDTVLMVNSKNLDEFQVAGKSRKLNASKNDKEEAYSTGGRTGGRADFQNLSMKRKQSHSKRKLPRK